MANETTPIYLVVEETDPAPCDPCGNYQSVLYVSLDFEKCISFIGNYLKEEPIFEIRGCTYEIQTWVDGSMQNILGVPNPTS